MYWGGDNKLPQMAKDTIRVATVNGYEVRLWGQGADQPKGYQAYDWAVANKRWSVASEVLRHWAVLSFGGIYMDTDMEWRQDPYEYIKHYAWFCTGETPHYCNAAFSGGTQGNVISHDMLSTINDINFETWKPKRPIEVEVGPHLLTWYWNMYVSTIHPGHAAHGCERTLPASGKSVAAILPMAKFFGLDYLSYHRKTMPIPESAILVHHWAKTW